MTSCTLPRGQIQPQKTLLPATVKRIMIPAMTIIGGGTNPLDK
jgi:hypothetical protein